MTTTVTSIPPELMLPAAVTPLARFRSKVVRELAAQAFPKDLVFLHGERQGPKRISLTFDDGPDDMTPRYLELCDQFQVRATFFLIGARAERRPEAVRDIVKAGHEVAGHGFTHKAFPSLGTAELSDELIHAADVLPPTATKRPLVRPPKGAVTAGSLFRTAASGFTSVLWSVDSDDCRTMQPSKVAEALSPNRLKTGDVVLLHEGQEWTLAALHTMIPRLIDAGFELVTVSELLPH